MTSLELAPMVPEVHRFNIGPTAITTAIERLRAQGRLGQKSIAEVMAAFPVLPSEADIDFAKWYVRWITSELRREATQTNSFLFAKRSGNLKA